MWNTASESEIKVLEAFGAALAQRPIDMKAVARAREDVRNISSDEIVLETACVAASFASITKVVETTGRLSFSQKFRLKKYIRFIGMRYGSTIRLTLGVVFASMVIARYSRK